MTSSMARLNEPPATSMEDIEILKRKFLRQNRDIARTNSAQSVRIRNLENEMSRLLSENLTLRGEIIRLQSESQSSNNRSIVQHVTVVKDQLQEKLLQLGILLGHLDQSSLNEVKKTSREDERKLVKVREASTQRPQKTAGGQEGSGQSPEDGRLPPIFENKLYPRRTLNQDEVERFAYDIQGDSTNSPDIGPPPVSQFVNEDPMKMKSLQKETDQRGFMTHQDQDATVNFELRKKRKDGADLAESQKIISSLPVPERIVSKAVCTLRAGAKRKFSSQNGEEILESASILQQLTECSPRSRMLSGEKQDTLPVKHANHNVEKGNPNRKSATHNAPLSTSASRGRKVLAAKTTNKNLTVSPEKTMKILDKKSQFADTDQKPIKAIEKSVDRNVRILKDVSSELSRRSDLNDPAEPETPGNAITIPPDAPRNPTIGDSRDTPPPSDLGFVEETQRPSRRARASISYAEPNLRDKMRRPTKELVDAVARDAKGNSLSGITFEDESEGHIRLFDSEKQLIQKDSGHPTKGDNDWHDALSPLNGKVPPEALALNKVARRQEEQQDNMATGNFQEIFQLEKGDNHNDIKADQSSITHKLSVLKVGDDAKTVLSKRGSLPEITHPSRMSTNTRQQLSKVGDDNEDADFDECSPNGIKYVHSVTSSRRRRSMATKTGTHPDQMRYEYGDKSTQKRTDDVECEISTNSGKQSDKLRMRRRSMML